MPNVSTRVPKSTEDYPTKYVDFSPDKLSLERRRPYCMFFIMTHGLASRDRNASGCAFTPQSQPDMFRNRSTAIISRAGTTGPSGTGVNTGARLRSGPKALVCTRPK